MSSDEVEFSRAFGRIAARFRFWHAVDAATHFLIIGGFAALLPMTLSRFIVISPTSSVDGVIGASLVFAVVFSAWAVAFGAPTVRFVAQTIDRRPADELVPTAADLSESGQRGPLEEALYRSAKRHIDSLDPVRFRPLGQSSRVLATVVVWLLTLVLAFFPRAEPSESAAIDERIRQLLSERSELSEEARRALESVTAQKTPEAKRAALERAAETADQAVAQAKLSGSRDEAQALAEELRMAPTPEEIRRLQEKIARAAKNHAWSPTDAAAIADAARKMREKSTDPDSNRALDEIEKMLGELSSGTAAGSHRSASDPGARSEIAAAESFRRVIIEAYAELGMGTARPNTTVGDDTRGDRVSAPRFDRAEFADFSARDRSIVERYAHMRWLRSREAAARR